MKDARAHPGKLIRYSWRHDEVAERVARRTMQRIRYGGAAGWRKERPRLDAGKVNVERVHVSAAEGRSAHAGAVAVPARGIVLPRQRPCVCDILCWEPTAHQPEEAPASACMMMGPKLSCAPGT